MVESTSAGTTVSKNAPTIGFLGITGSGKTTLMNAFAGQVLGKQAQRGELQSTTTEVTVYKNIPFLGDEERLVDLIDFPGLLDTEGRDQEFLDNMVREIKEKCPKIDIMILCFVKDGKFD